MNRNEAKPKKAKNHSLISAIIVTLVLLIGLSLLLYPTVADYINSLDYKKEIESYQREVQELDDSTRQAMLAAARKYNADLLSRSVHIGSLNTEQRNEYTRLLNPSGNGMMGYIEVKTAGIYLPIYHGTEERVLQSGIGHIEGSSLPVGGTGVHTILSGHTGLPSTKLFSNIDRLEIGDEFELHILGETLTYRVESTIVVLPDEAERQEIDPQRDLCTLMTCTPYGVNSHRLLVTGVRIATPQAAPSEENDMNTPTEAIEHIPVPVPPAIWAAAIALPLAAAGVILASVDRKRKRRKHPSNQPVAEGREEEPGT